MKKFSESSSYKWWVLLTVQCALFLLGADSTIVNIALPTMAKELQLNITVAQWILSTFLMSMAIALPITGRIADILGKKKVFIAGLVTLAISSYFCAVTKSFEFLLIMRVFQGIGCAACLANCNAIISTIFHADRHALALGLNATVYSLGMGTGVLVSGYLIINFGWPSIFYISAIFAMIFTLIAAIVLNENTNSITKKESRSFDYLGSALLTLSIAGMMFGAINYLNNTTDDHLWFYLFFLGICFLLTFIITESLVKIPLVNLNLYKNYYFSIGNIIRALHTMVANSILFVIPFFAEESLHFSPSKSGLVLLPYAIGLLIAGPLGGYFSDKIGEKVIMFSGFLIFSLSLICLILVKEENQQVMKMSEFVKLIAGLFLFGTAAAIVGSANNSATLKAVPHSQKGVSSGLLYTAGYLGGACGIAISSQMIRSASTSFMQTSIAIAHAKTNIFYILLIIIILGAVICLFSPKTSILDKK